jgi:hypothetical protein
MTWARGGDRMEVTMGNSTMSVSVRAACLGLGLVVASLGASATEINITFSDDFSKDLSKDYGEREGAYLSGMIDGRVMDALEAAGLQDRVARVDITLLDAKPNRPTLQQMSKQPGLSMQSFSIGGASLTGRMYDAQNALIGETSHDWYESDIRQAQYNATWTDARRAIDRFARKLADAETAPAEAMN